MKIVNRFVDILDHQFLNLLHPEIGANRLLSKIYDLLSGALSSARVFTYGCIESSVQDLKDTVEIFGISGSFVGIMQQIRFCGVIVLDGIRYLYRIESNTRDDDSLYRSVHIPI
ncbi:hypothetical protein SDC9_168299 [bioreactor metagenome]|uniref:Uncharacterized protein n=1 Tax=bioreactor metagenome TaxID=1076179 RepID=A0A645G4S6_9ZZZZ